MRRLLPVECERLQGFPDHFTLLPDQARRKLEADMAAWLRERFPDMSEEDVTRTAADGPRMRALGNSMAVPVMAWIGRRLLLVDGA